MALGDAPLPSCQASWDTTGATRENTVDLESLGSTAPGAQLYDVYGSSAAPVALDTEFSDILSPPGVLGSTLVHELDNVSVIVSSWGQDNHYDAAWYADLEQAQARGISVLAASGDADDSPASPYWTGTFAEFPAAMAYDTFGDVAVGGTSLTLDPSTLHLSTNAAWDVPLNPSGPVGSEGGSAGTIVAEPTWQLSSSANHNLSGNGRGVPDLGAIANNSLVTLTVKGYRYQATNATTGGAFEAASGTSVAVSVVAGLVAEIDHAMKSTGAAPLGFFDPALYYWADQEYTNQSCGTKTLGASCGGVYPYVVAYPARPGRGDGPERPVHGPLRIRPRDRLGVAGCLQLHRLPTEPLLGRGLRPSGWGPGPGRPDRAQGHLNVLGQLGRRREQGLQRVVPAERLPGRQSGGPDTTGPRASSTFTTLRPGGR